MARSSAFPGNRLVDKPLLRRFERGERDPHEDMHQRRRRSDDPRQALGAAATRQNSDIDLRQPDLKIAGLRDANVAGQGKFKPASHRGAGDRRDDGLRHLFDKAHGGGEAAGIVGRILGPLFSGALEPFTRT